MIEAWALWLLIVGVVAGGIITWLAMVRLPRGEDDVSRAERPAEAAWISRVIERHGGVAPASLVEEVLDLHQAYLADPRLAQPPVPTWTPSASPPGPAGSYPPVAPGWAPSTADPAAPGWSPPPRQSPSPGWSPPPGRAAPPGWVPPTDAAPPPDAPPASGGPGMPSAGR